jgi:GH24 family phage-related lysozyme (muramidase)
MEFSNKKELVKKVQKSLGLKDDGVDGPKTWEAITAKIVNDDIVSAIPPIVSVSPTNVLSQKAFRLILKYEVGGGINYYNKCLKHPCYPGGESGVTIGIGYDLGYNTSYQFAEDWKGIINTESYIRLLQHLGKKSTNAKAAIASVKDIEIPWEAAEIVFKKNTLPRFIEETKKAFPNSENLHPDAFGALVSLVFNRGASVSGQSRAEMLNIRNLIDSKDYKAIANQIRQMKRLWINKGLDGLLTRRDEEASLVASCD